MTETVRCREEGRNNEEGRYRPSNVKHKEMKEYQILIYGGQVEADGRKAGERAGKVGTLSHVARQFVFKETLLGH